MTPRIIRDWDASTKALEAAFAEALALMRGAADDPDLGEGDLREHLRQAAKLTEHFAHGQIELMRFNRRGMIRFEIGRAHV